MAHLLKGILNFQNRSLIFTAGVQYDPGTNELVIPIDAIKHRASDTRPVGIYKETLRVPAGVEFRKLYTERRQ